jgi:hypothetical protein
MVPPLQTFARSDLPNPLSHSLTSPCARGRPGLGAQSVSCRGAVQQVVAVADRLSFSFFFCVLPFPPPRWSCRGRLGFFWWPSATRRWGAGLALLRTGDFAVGRWAEDEGGDRGRRFSSHNQAVARRESEEDSHTREEESRQSEVGNNGKAMLMMMMGGRSTSRRPRCRLPIP